MRRIITTAAAMVLTMAASALAADDPQQKPALRPSSIQPQNPAPQTRPGTSTIRVGEGGGFVGNGGQGWVGSKSQAEWYINGIDKTVSLTDDQKKSITRIFEERDKAQQEWQKTNAEKLAAARGALNDAYKSKDKDAMAKAQKEFTELYSPMQQMMKKYQTDLTAVLTPDQQAKLRESRANAMIKSMTDPVTLTDDQMKKIKAALPKEGTGERDNSFYQAVQDTLTEEQKEQIGKHRAVGYVKMMFGPAKLTDEQMKKAEAAYEELAKDKSSKPGSLFTTLHEKVNAMLTDEQKEAMKKSGFGGAGGAAIGQPGAPAAAPQKK